LLDRIWSHTSVEDRGHDTPCWVWTGALFGKGRYAAIKVGSRTNNSRRMRAVHIVAREALHLEPPRDGEEHDHLCSVKACWRPSHVEPVTGEENRRRYGVLMGWVS